MQKIQVGTIIPALTLPPVSRTTLALYAGASGDHNPMHIDYDVAKAAGMPDVFAQGMLPMAWLGRMLTDWQSQLKLRKFSSRFKAVTHLQDVITCSGIVVEIVDYKGEATARCEIKATKQSGEVAIVGEALVAI